MAKQTPKTRGILPNPLSQPTAPVDSGSTPENTGATAPKTPEVLSDKIERFAVPLDPATGAFQFENMRPATKKKLLDAIGKIPQDEKNAGAATSAEEQALNALLVNVLFDLVGFGAMIVARQQGYSVAAAQKLAYTEQEKSTFMAPTIAVLNKYNLLGGKWREELALLAIVSITTFGHVQAMKKADADEKGGAQ